MKYNIEIVRGSEVKVGDILTTSIGYSFADKAMRVVSIENGGEQYIQLCGPREGLDYLLVHFDDLIPVLRPIPEIRA